jgi:hypothetical protein
MGRNGMAKDKGEGINENDNEMGGKKISGMDGLITAEC